MASTEILGHARQIEQITSGATSGTDGWQGRGADGYRITSEHLRGDLLMASQAFERTAGYMNILASQLDQVNQIFRQCDHLQHQIYSMQAELWSVDDPRRSSLQERISDLRHQLYRLENEAEYIERQANHQASQGFEEVSAIVNRLYFGSNSLETNTSIADKVGEFFGGMWDKVSAIHEEIEENGGVIGGLIGFTEGLIGSLVSTLEVFWQLSPTYSIYQLLTNPEGTKAKAEKLFQTITHPIETGKAMISGIPKVATVVWSTFDQDVLNGNGYTQGKWFGYLTGFIGESVLPATKMAKITKSVQTVDRVEDLILDEKKPDKPIKETDDVGSTTSVEPAPGTLSNVDARKWYLEQEKKIPLLIDTSLPKKDQAKQAFDLRNGFRTQARELMADRELAEKLMREEPNLTWEAVVQKAINKGYSGDEVYQSIIDSSQRSRTSVNKKLGLE